MSDNVLVIDAGRIYAGICYYADQLDLWREVVAFEPASLERLKDRLEIQKPEVVVTRGIWRQMSDRARLKLLMEGSKTTAVFLPGTLIGEFISSDDAKRRRSKETD